MQAGRLNRRCALQQPATDKDEAGQPIPGWEAIKAGAPVSTIQASIRVRYRAGITAGMRVTHGGTIYNITAVLPDVARREFLDLICEVHS